MHQCRYSEAKLRLEVETERLELGRREHPVEAVEGLGEVAVNGDATPETIELARDGDSWRLVRRWPRRQAIALRSTPSGVDRVELTGARAELPQEVALKIAAGVAALEGARGTPLDVEWAVRGREVAFLQARPQSRPLVAGLPPGEVWTRTNVRELTPEIGSAFGASVVLRPFDVYFRAFYRRMGVPLPEPVPVLAMVAGRAVANGWPFGVDVFVSARPGPKVGVAFVFSFAVRRLHAMGLEVAMLTGDSRAVAVAVNAQLLRRSSSGAAPPAQLLRRSSSGAPNSDPETQPPPGSAVPRDRRARDHRQYEACAPQAIGLSPAFASGTSRRPRARPISIAALERPYYARARRPRAGTAARRPRRDRRGQRAPLPEGPGGASCATSSSRSPPTSSTRPSRRSCSPWRR